MEKNECKLDNIKSIKIFKIVLYSLSRRSLLDLLHYNKKLQNKLYINIEEYKRFGNKSILIEDNGLGKEYE